MKTVPALLDKAKVIHKLPSDYKLALVMGISFTSLGNYRHGKTLPDARVICKICELTGDDPALLAVEIEAERAKTDDAKTLWASIAQRLSSAIIIPKEKAPELDAAGGLDTWRKRRDSNPR